MPPTEGFPPRPEIWAPRKSRQRDRPFSTRELPALCTRLPSWEDLRTGDILIAPGRHVLLFIQWEGTEKNRFLGSEAGPLPAWKCSEHVFSRAMLENSGYRPMRYRGMRD